MCGGDINRIWDYDDMGYGWTDDWWKSAVHSFHAWRNGMRSLLSEYGKTILAVTGGLLFFGGIGSVLLQEHSLWGAWLVAFLISIS